MFIKLSILILLTILLSIEAIMNDDQVDVSKFDEWKRSYQKSYSSPGDEDKAKRNLVKNLREIERHNIRFRAGLETYSRGVWEHSDLSYEEKIEILAGSRINTTRQALQGRSKTIQKGPTQVNWVMKGRVHPVQNQGRCGSCFAFATVGAFEGVALSKGIKTRFSVQQIVDCDSSNGGCDGQ